MIPTGAWIFVSNAESDAIDAERKAQIDDGLRKCFIDSNTSIEPLEVSFTV